MKFLNKNNNFFLKNFYNNFNQNTPNIEDFYKDYFFEKFFIKRRKTTQQFRPGVIKNIKKSSLKRNDNFNFLKQYINLSQKKGKKINFLKNLNKSIENLFYVLSTNFEEFKHYKNYNNLVHSHNNNLLYSNIDDFLKYSLNNLESIFEIKTIKNNKKLKLLNKYTYEIVNIPKKKR